MKSPPQNRKLVDHLRKFSEAKSTGPVESGTHMNDVNTMSIERRIPANKGKWCIFPPGIEDKEYMNE